MRLALVISAIMFAAILQSSLAGQAGNKRQQAGPHNIEAANGEQNSPPSIAAFDRTKQSRIKHYTAQ